MYRDVKRFPYVITAFNGRITALAIETGKVAWGVKLDIEGGVVQLHVDEHRVVALGIGELAIIEYATGKVLASHEIGGTLLVDGDTAFVSSNGVLTAIDLATAKRRWTNELKGTGYGAAAIATPNRAVQAQLG